MEMSPIITTQTEFKNQYETTPIPLDPHAETRATWNWKHIIQNVIAAELVMGVFIVFWYLVTYYHYRSVMSWYHAPDMYIEINVEKMMQPELIGRALLIIALGAAIFGILFFAYSGIVKLKNYLLQSRKKAETSTNNHNPQTPSKLRRLYTSLLIIILLGTVALLMNLLANFLGQTESKLELQEAEYHSILYENHQVKGLIIDTYKDFYIVAPIQNNVIIPEYELVAMQEDNNQSPIQIVDGEVQLLPNQDKTLQVKLVYTGQMQMKVKR